MFLFCSRFISLVAFGFLFFSRVPRLGSRPRLRFDRSDRRGALDRIFVSGSLSCGYLRSTESGV